MKWKYGNAWEEFPIEPGEVWGIPANGSSVAVHDIFQPLPDFMLQADLIVSDPPWNGGNLKSFYTKAGREDYQEWSDFADVFFQRIAQIDPNTCYIEIGNQFVDEWQERLHGHYPAVQHWPVLYYRKNPTNLIRGSRNGQIGIDFFGMDEADCIAKIGQIEQYEVMGDPCMGQGLVGISAWDAGKPFVGTELNKRRLANLLQKLAKRGATIRRKHKGESV